MKKSRPLSLPTHSTPIFRVPSERIPTKEETQGKIFIGLWWVVVVVGTFILIPGMDGSLAQFSSRFFVIGLTAGTSWLVWRWQQRQAVRAVVDRNTTDQILTEQRGLLHTLIGAQERERKRLATEWHDRLGTKLFEVLQGFRSCQTLIAQRAPESQERFAQFAAELDGMAALVRAFTNELHPPVLDEFGFVAALREYLAGLDGQDPFRVTFQAEGEDQQLEPDTQAALFRISQEALQNIRTHARANQVIITFVAKPTEVALVIRDNGQGFHPNQVPSGCYGLLYMRERADACGGTVQITSAPGQGTEVRVDFPATGGGTAQHRQRKHPTLKTQRPHPLS